MDDLYLKKIIDGDAGSFRYFVKKYKDAGYSLSMSVVKDEFLAQEVLQSAFIKAYSGIEAFKGKSKFSTWFYRILINEAFKASNKHSNKQKKNNNIDIELISGKLPDADYFETGDKEEYQKHCINEALKRINPRESLALRLFYLEECSIEDITEITGWTDSNVKVILHRARAHMKQVLEKCYKSDKKVCINEKY
jgi:RNA polymerase sigma-70 factor (ECF subfamily)